MSMRRSVFGAVVFAVVMCALSMLHPGELSARELPEAPMRMVYFENFPPFSWRGEDGVMKGILIDVMDEAAGRRMGISLVHEGFPWARAQEMVREGKADAFVTIPTPARREYTEVAGEPLVLQCPTVFTKAGHERMKEIESIEKIDDLKGFVILDYFGDGWGDANLADMNRYMVSQFDTVLTMLAGGRGDLCVAPSVVAMYALKRLGLQGQVVQTSVVLGESPFHLCVGTTSPYAGILPDFDGVMKEIREAGGLEKIYDKYR